MNSGNLLRRISITGAALMLGGMGLVFFEVQTGYLHRRLGLAGHFLSIISGTTLSIWGLKEVVSQLWPRLAGRGYHFRIPGVGLAYLAIMFVLFIGSILARSNLLIMVFCVMAGSFVVNGWLTFTMLRRTRMQRDVPDRVMAGETFMVTLLLENRNTWLSCWLMRLQDSIRNGGLILEPEVLFVRVPPNSHRVGTYHLCPIARGRYEFTHLDVMTRFPLGMVERGVGREAPHVLLVYPRLGHLRPQFRRILQHSMELVSHARPNNGTFQDDMHRIREFRQGDDRRMIHWRTSARMNDLMVCEYHECRDRDLMIIVDAWLPSRPSVKQTEQFERGLRFAATVSMNYLRSSRQSSLTVRLLGKETFDWFGDTGQQNADSLLDAFALLEPSHREDFHRLGEGLGTKWSGQCRTLVISPRPMEFKEELLRIHPGSAIDLQVYGTSEEELNGLFEDSDAPSDSEMKMQRDA
ncbi:DUF58 domain-containing protein [Planctomicrobium sp. SH661]|uniref:DUF58 domain-containing protein n=1 Tax=Planctomicrobium sp. SH661 TaxID=3448124 RepID=UPI003F5B152C